MKNKLIACNIFQREVCACLARTTRIVDVEFLDLGEHLRPDGLRQLLQARIDAADAPERDYDAVLLLFGLCGNAGVGLVARRIPLVIPRAHDCATILLGSREAFKQHFGDNPSQGFSSNGYFDRGTTFLRTGEDSGGMAGDEAAYQELVKQHGEDNARYVWDTMHPVRPGDDRARFIRMPGIDDSRAIEQFSSKAEESGKRCELLDGNLQLISALIEGDWSPDDFLIVPPGQRTEGVYDWDEIIRARST
jgi:hypothetical protein